MLSISVNNVGISKERVGVGSTGTDLSKLNTVNSGSLLPVLIYHLLYYLLYTYTPTQEHHFLPYLPNLHKQGNLTVAPLLLNVN